MQRTKIFMTADPIGEIWVYILDLCSGLGAWNCDIVLATTGRFLTASQIREVARLPHVQLYESAAKLEWLEHPRTALEQAGLWLRDLAKATQPDVIHLNGYVHGAIAWPAPVLLTGYSSILAWWDAVKGKPAQEQWLTHRKSVRESLTSADLVVAPTQTMLNALQQAYGPLPNTKVIYPGRRQTLFAPAAKENLILASGDLGDKAGNFCAVEAVVPQLPLAEQGWSIYCAGEQARLTQSSPIQQLGNLSSEQMASWLARASIYALPARYTPLGLSVLEAAFCGCALVLGDIPSLCEIWQDAALYVPPTDHTALATALNRLIQDTKFRERLAASAHKRAETFTANRTVAAYWHAYRSIIKPSTIPTKSTLNPVYIAAKTNIIAV